VVKGGRSYRVQAQLGRGAFGAVYLAETVGTGLERRVAVKLLRPEKAAEPGLVGRLRDEARMLAAIRHRSIVRVDDLVELDGTWAIVMEYVEGCDLTEFLSLGPVPPVAALAITEEVASALHAAAHQAGPDGRPLKLIHRDIKPSNLRITAQGEIKILDFGVARAELNAREEATREAAFGTVPYMAPERFYGEDTHAGDIYALGVTAFEMLTGVKPGKTAMDADRQPPGGRLQAQWSWLAEVSQPLHDLVASMLAKKPDDRPTARETARLCAIIRASLPGESLDEWAENVVPSALRVQEERRATAAAERTGTILVERSGSHSASGKARPRGAAGAMPAWLAAPAALLVAGGVASAIFIPAVVIRFSAGDKGEAQATVESVIPTTSAAVPQAATPPVATTPVPAPASPAALSSSPPPQLDQPAATPPPTAATATAAYPAATGVKAGSTVEAAPRAATAPTATAPAVPEATATPAEPAGPGRVSLGGDAVSAKLTGAAGSFGPGELPPGTYTAEVSFGEGSPVSLRVQVESGNTTQLRCSRSFGNCKVIKE